ncbi:AmpG family muropeptide MFS transporter [Candidatus Paracaedibacter symbiosus]|uniref:AmpG family muropeptide MFS transporter n=1 Tax=Candidatus Paracaedibacter symbiosus TaxID=244582 RepID=UPI0005094D35|nr:MFS transporter [Candidatus Paracaedibacter symbiosus]
MVNRLSFLNKNLWIILLLGFSSGLPFLLTLSTLSFWLTESGIDKTTIGLFMLISLPYSLKFFWAPMLDRVKIPLISQYFGQRRSWALLAQLGLILSIVALGFCNPSNSILLTAACAFLVALFSATQDIVYDAYRIEIISDSNRGMAAALESVGFRFGMIASGAGALYLAALFDWQTAYHLMAAAMLIGMITVLVMPEPKLEKVVQLKESPLPRSFSQRIQAFVLQPWRQFSHKETFGSLVLFIFCFKFADAVLNSMSAPFLCDLGFSKVEFANISKIFGITLMVVGGLLGGLLIRRFGALNAVILSTLLQGMSCLMFAIQALVGYDYNVLIITVGAESLCSGLISTVFIAYISVFCCKPHTATHFTLLYSIGSFARVAASAIAGWLADHCSWSLLFLVCALLVVPTIGFVLNIEKKRDTEPLENPIARVA